MAEPIRLYLRAVKTPNMITQSIAGLGLMGLLLSIVGLYGLVSYSVSRRIREIGIRMAIGSDRRCVIRMILWQGLKLGLIGLGIGLVASFFACRLLTANLWIATFSHVNYWVFASVALPLLLVMVLATYGGRARRASLIDPMRALFQFRKSACKRATDHTFPAIFRAKRWLPPR